MKYVRILLASLMAMPLMSCSGIGAGETDYCVLYTPVLVGKQDKLTEETAKHILLLNKTWRKECT